MKALSARRAFLVMVSDESDPDSGGFCGRVEHIESGRRRRFVSHEELNEFVAEILMEQHRSPAPESGHSELS
jgi:hypothetical protein